MEYAILAVETNDLDSLVETFKRKIEPELNPSSFSILFEQKSRNGEARLLVIEAWYSRFLEQAGYLTGTVIFESRGDQRCLITIVVTGGATNFRSVAEFKILDSIKNPMLKVAARVSIVYASAWLYDEDEKVRQKAISAIEGIGGYCIVDKLIRILKHDINDSILDSAVISLGRIGDDEAIDPITSIARKKNNLITTCANALVNMRSPKAIEGLKELLAYCEQSELVAEAKMVRQAIQRAKYGEGCKEVICTVCSQPIEESEEVVGCRACGKVAHKLHMLEWLHVHRECPSCGHELVESDLVDQSVKANPLQQKPNRAP